MKLLFKNPVVIFASLYLIAILCWDVALFLNPDKSTLLNYWFNAGYGLIYLAGGILGLIYSRQLGFKSVFGKAFAFIGTGLVSYAVAQFVWLFYNVSSSVEIPYPSIADVFFLLFFPLIFIGFMLFINTFKQSITKKVAIESVILVPIVFIVSLAIIFRPDLSSDLSFMQKALNILYPVSDTLFLCLILIVLRVSGGYLRSTILLFVTAGIMQLIADFLFTYRSANDIYWNGDVSDLAFTIASFLFLLSFVYFMQKMVGAKPQTATATTATASAV
ncbi:MAG: hypothetical protein NTZ87_02680 [Candidatus Nomurabacteria bacterium]|nr:hypothetical protein [Candidatus Nomurabacteria bacterium]